MPKPVLLIGSGGHASVLLEILQEQGVEILAYVDPRASVSAGFAQLRHLASDEEVQHYAVGEVELVLGLGSLPGNDLRKRVFDRFKAMGYRFRTVVASSAVMSPSAVLDEGVQVLHGGIVSANAQIGRNTIINTRASIDHDCQLGADNHVAPGAVLCGGVKTGSGVHVGTAAGVIQSIQIGNNVTVGAGATVTRNVPDGMVVYPARGMMKQQNIHEVKA